MTSSGGSGGHPHFTPKITAKDKGRIRYQDPTLSRWLSHLKLSAFQLSTVAGAAVLAKTAVAPLERVKILKQVGPVEISSANVHTKGAWRIIKDITRRHGWRALYRGHGANVVRVVPEVMLKFGIHDQLRIICGASAADPSQLPLSSRIAAGSMTGLLRTALLHPLSVVRTRLTADCRSNHGRYHGMYGCLTETWARERWRGLYGGFSLAAWSSVPYLIVCFAVYDSLVDALPRDKESVHEWWYPVAKMGCAAGAGMAAQVATFPLDTMRRRLELLGANNSGSARTNILAMARRIHQTEGLRGFYRGLAVNCVKTVPSTALQFIAYDLLKTSLMMVDPSTAAAAGL